MYLETKGGCFMVCVVVGLSVGEWLCEKVFCCHATQRGAIWVGEASRVVCAYFR